MSVSRSLAIALLMAIVVSVPVFGQGVVVTDAPADYQLYPRDNTDSSMVRIAGEVSIQNRQQARLVIIQGAQVWRVLTQDLVYSGGTASFEFTPKIPAARINHRFILDIDGYEIASRHSVVCGEAIMLDGQSNTVADRPTDYGGEWVRSFGTTSDDPYTIFSDTTWGLAVSGPGLRQYAIGTWGMVVGQRLSEYLDMPVAVINGSVGGTPIYWHYRDYDNPYNLDTIYGRLLYRMTKSGLKHHTKAILWHQGESDSWQGWAHDYLDRWDTLYNDWAVDYTAVEQIYTCQIRPSWGVDVDQDEIREVQRIIPQHYDNVQVMSTAGLDGYDGLHYSASGYEGLGELLWPLVAHDVFDRPIDVTNYAPDVLEARYITPEQDQLAVRFSQPVVWPADSLGQPMRQYFYLGEYWGLVNGGVVWQDDPSVVILDLDGPQFATDLSYTPEKYDHDGNIYQGPWIRNPAGVGALCFDMFPIDPAVSVELSSDPEGTVQLGEGIEVIAKLTNSTPQLAQREVWTAIYNPNGQRIRSFGPYSLDVQPSAYIELHLYHVVPQNYPTGMYEYRVVTGPDSQHIAASDTMYVEVVNATR